jgi:hypothetical protein
VVGGGAIYTVLFLYGMVVDGDGDADFVPVNTADDWLHLGLAALLRPRTPARTADPRGH